MSPAPWKSTPRDLVALLWGHSGCVESCNNDDPDAMSSLKDATLTLRVILQHDNTARAGGVELVRRQRGLAGST
jgi:hypothetical protein